MSQQTDIGSLTDAFLAANLPYLKVELEAQFDRGNFRDPVCRHCEGVGQQSCKPCQAMGLIKEGSAVKTCTVCNGEGAFVCLSCTGRGRATRMGSDPWVNNWLYNSLSRSVQRKIKYFKFYNDRSCDSEVTLTIHVRDIGILPTVIKQFLAIGELTMKNRKQKYDVRGAGIHIALMAQAEYPTNLKLPKPNVDNLCDQVRKLLPALYFLGASGKNTRSLMFRAPQIGRSNDTEGRVRYGRDKYSALYTRGDTVLEYRIFETCYRHPEQIFDFLATVANTLQFYANPRKKVKPFNHEFVFKSGDSLTRFFQDEKSLEILDKQLAILKPAWKTIDELKKERGFDRYDIKRLALRRQNKEALWLSQFQRLQPMPRLSMDTLVFMAREVLHLTDDRELTDYLGGKSQAEVNWDLFKASNDRPIRARFKV